jgi:Rod binding domain-containing protein
VPLDAARATSERPLSRTKAIDPERAREVAKDFEAVFLSQYIGFMFQGVQTDGMFGGGTGEDIFRSLLIQEYGRLVADRGGIGIADAVLSQMLRMQGESR